MVGDFQGTIVKAPSSGIYCVADRAQLDVCVAIVAWSKVICHTNNTSRSRVVAGQLATTLSMTKNTLAFLTFPNQIRPPKTGRNLGIVEMMAEAPGSFLILSSPLMSY